MKLLVIFLFGMFCFGRVAFAAPTSLSYQGRILQSDGKPLDYANVSFLFQITTTVGTCVLYEEQLNNFNMSGSGGVFDAPIGNGTRLFPTSGSATILDVFNNVALSLPCKGGSTFIPTVNDARRLRVQFHDGNGWKQITPDNLIRSVPYASFSLQAAQLGSYSPENFVIKAEIPGCTSNTFLSWNGTALTCKPVSGSAGGTVTSVASTNSYLSVTNGSSNASLTLNVGTGANTVAAGDDSRFTDARPPTGNAGGILSGTYPNPGLSNSSVTTAALNDGSVTTAKISAVGASTGQVLRYSGAAWQATKLNYADLVNANNVSPWPGTCGAGQFITWVSITDGFACTAFNSSAVTTALGYTPANAALTLTAGTGLTGGGDLTANRTFNVNVGTGANQIPQLDGSGKLALSVIPSSISDGAWAADGSGNIYRASGYIGIGTTTPSAKLHVVGGNLSVTGSSSPTFTLQTNNTAGGAARINQFGGANTSGGIVGAIGFINAHTDWTAETVAEISARRGAGGPHEGSLRFATKTQAGALTEWMRIQPDGNVGIGLTAPTAKLEIAGTETLTALTGTLSSTGYFGQIAGVGTQFLSELTVGASIRIDGVDHPVTEVSSDTELWLDATMPTVAAGTTAYKVGSSATLLKAGRLQVNDTAMTFNGPVGIGTTSPASLLAVVGGDATVYTPSGATVAPYTNTAMPVLKVGNSDGTAGTAAFIELSAKNTTRTGVSYIGAISTNNYYESEFVIGQRSGSSNYAERLRINANGNVGIGTTAPTTKLDLYSSTTSNGLTIRNATNNVDSFVRLFTLNDNPTEGLGSGNPSGGNKGWNINAIGDGGTPSNTLSAEYWSGSSWIRTLTLTPGGNVGIGTLSPSSRLHVTQSTAGVVATFANSAGTCTFTPTSGATNWACTSDEKLKKNIENISGEEALDRLLGLHAVTYQLKKGDEGQRHTGYIAQNVRDVASEFVTEGADGLLQVSYTGFIPWITEGLKTLHLKVLNLARQDQEHSRDIASLQGQIALLEKEKVDLQADNQTQKKQHEEMRKYLCEKDPQAPFCL